MKRYPIGKQDFQSLREEGYIYVDKTSFIAKLLEGSQIYFLARPRRFGKSLFLSTLECFFLGKKYLFNDLDIESYNWDWEEYPVIRIDLGPKNYLREESLDERLDAELARYESKYDIIPSNKANLDGRLESLIIKAHAVTGKKVVVLVDEYEKPVIDTIGSPSLRIRFQETLRGFYSVLKALDASLKLVFLTGVTKFGHMSVFSGLNNIRDISLNNEFSSICGITYEELKTNFKEGISALAQDMGCDYDNALNILKKYYDGYHFSRNCVDIYNPTSVISALANSMIMDYWWQTGTPKFLVDILQNAKFPLPEMDNIRINGDSLLNLNEDASNPIPLLYQTGYLSIKSFDSKTNLYHLGFPNKEVRSSFFGYLTPFYTAVSAPRMENTLLKLTGFIEKGNAAELMQEIQSFFAGNAYSLKGSFTTEEHFQNVVYIIAKLLSDNVETEYRTAVGRIDLLIRTPRFIYILEFKIDSNAETALQQINDKNYALPFETDNREIIKIGINFSTRNRTITEWAISR